MNKEVCDRFMCKGELPLWGILLLILLVILDGIFYGFAAALQNLNESDVEKRSEAGDKKEGRLLYLISHPARYINTIPLLSALTVVCLGVFMVPWGVGLLQDRIGTGPALLITILILVLVFSSAGVLAFRRVGTFYPERFARRYSDLVWIVSGILFPPGILISWAARILAIPFGVGFHKVKEAMTEEEIINLVDEAHEQGVIEENEAEMIQNIMAFNDTKAGDIMTHRKNVIAFDEEILLQELVEEMLEEGNSRYPVYRGNIDNIVGIVHYKDTLKFNTKNSWAKFKPLKELPGLIREAAFIPETHGIGDLFHTMQEEKLHMAVVVDEYGQTAGIVSMEDILEEIVGEILDEYDEDEVQFRTQRDNSVVIDALASLEDVEEKLGIQFGETSFETLNGVLTSILGHIPTEKDMDKELTVCGYRFRIISLGNKTIGKVRASRIGDAPEEAETMEQK